MNKIIISGRLTADPEMKVTQSGKNVTNYSVAVKRTYVKDGERDVDYFSITTFGKAAEYICQYGSKGMSILVEGKIHEREYTDRDGNTRRIWNVLSDSVELFFSPKKSQETPENASQSVSKNSSYRGVDYEFEPAVNADIDADALPF